MEQTKCKVCGHELTISDQFCSECGFEYHILPDLTSRNVILYENKRIEKYKSRWEQVQKQEKEIEKLTLDLQTAKSKTVADSQEINRLRTDLKHANSQISVNEIEKNEQLSLLKKQYAIAISDKENAENLYRNEQDAHNRTKLQVKQLQEKIDHLSTVNPHNNQSSEPLNSTTSNNSNTIIGKAMFTFGGRTETVELHSGLCRVTAPQWTNIGGDLFEINGDKGVYRLYDIKGNMCDRFGKPVPSQGATTRNNDVFTVGSLTIRFSLPDIDYDDLY